MKRYGELYKDTTKFLFAETIRNPQCDVLDVKAISEIAHESEISLVVDNQVHT